MNYSNSRCSDICFLNNYIPHTAKNAKSLNKKTVPYGTVFYNNHANGKFM